MWTCRRVHLPSSGGDSSSLDDVWRKFEGKWRIDGHGPKHLGSSAARQDRGLPEILRPVNDPSSGYTTQSRS